MSHQFLSAKRVGYKVDETLCANRMEVTSYGVQVAGYRVERDKRCRNIPTITLRIFNSARTFAIWLVRRFHQSFSAGIDSSSEGIVNVRHIKMDRGRLGSN